MNSYYSLVRGTNEEKLRTVAEPRGSEPRSESCEIDERGSMKNLPAAQQLMLIPQDEIKT